MRPASPKRAGLLRRRQAMLAATTHGPERCQWPSGCTQEACDPHELLSRARGGSIVDADNIRLLCRPHHDWVTAHPAQAEAMGLSLSQYTQTPRVVSDTAATVGDVSDTAKHTPRVSFRMKAPGIAWLDELAQRHGLDRSEAIRACFEIAHTHAREVERRLHAVARESHPQEEPK